MRIPPKRSRLTPKLLAKLRYYLNFSHAKISAQKNYSPFIKKKKKYIPFNGKYIK